MFNYFNQVDKLNMEKCQMNKSKGKGNLSTQIQNTISSNEVHTNLI